MTPAPPTLPENIKARPAFCPRCGSEREFRRRRMKWCERDLLFGLLTFGLWFLFRLARDDSVNPWRCVVCGDRLPPPPPPAPAPAGE